MTEFGRKRKHGTSDFSWWDVLHGTGTRLVTAAEHAGLLLLLLLFSTRPGQLSSSLSASARWGDSTQLAMIGWLILWGTVVSEYLMFTSHGHDYGFLQCTSVLRQRQEESKFSRFLGWRSDFVFGDETLKAVTAVGVQQFQHACKKSYSSYTWFICKIT